MKFGIVLFPGSNCDRDTFWGLHKTMNYEVSNIRHDETDLGNSDVVILPGGFSYGDYLRAGAIAKYSPVMNSIVEFAASGGIVIGICNGFQILCEAGLLPGTLLTNTSGTFACKNTYIRVENSATKLSCKMKRGDILKIPMANKGGRFYSGPDELKKMNQNGQIIFRYCDKNGEINSASNPSDSAENIAGICNLRKNVFGMMPHPERALDIDLKNTDGQKIFESIRNSLLMNA